MIGEVSKIANIVNRAKNLANAFRNTKSLGQVNFSDWIIDEAEDTQSMFEGSGISQAILSNATFAKTKKHHKHVQGYPKFFTNPASKCNLW